jgi:NDP-sugar pyrophosphorylase family protein
VRALLHFHERGRFVATMGVKVYGVQIPFGVADVRGTTLKALEEKPTRRMLVNAGMYVLSPSVLKLLHRGRKCLMTDVFDQCLRRNLKVGAHLIEAEWTDVGRPDELQRARGEL